MVFVTVFIIIISRANVGNWTALRVDLSSHIHHVFFSRPSDVVKTVFVIVFRCVRNIACCYMWFFYIFHHFFILRFDVSIFVRYLL